MPGGDSPQDRKDNVWDIDCSGFFPADVSGMKVHSGYFETPAIIGLLAEVLRGIDRSVLVALGRTTSAAWTSPAATVDPVDPTPPALVFA